MKDSKDIYGRLADALNERSKWLPLVLCQEFYELAEELFTPEQAEIANNMPNEPVTIEKLATKIPEANVEELYNKLEEMAVRGLVVIKERGGKKHYELLPLAPGSLELQFIAGQTDERAKRIHILFRKYHKAILNQLVEAPSSVSSAKTEGSKVIPVKKTLDTHMSILPYNEVMRLIDSTEHIAAGTCCCRHGGDLGGKPCDRPKDNICMVFGESVPYTASYGFASPVSKDQARQIIDEAERTGLVHQYTNNKDMYIDFLCNCCGCHCGILKGVIHSPLPSITAKANWVIEVEDDECTGCGACIDRCWVKALKMEGDMAVCDENRCIGCGLCIYVCPTDALKLLGREIPV